MLPTIETPAKKVLSPKPLKSKHTIKVDLIRDQKGAKNRCVSPSLPLLSEGSLTSFVSSKSRRGRWKEKVKEKKSTMKPAAKIKQRGGGFKDCVNQRSTDRSNCNTSFAGIKTHDLQLQFQSALNVNKGWSVQNPNPRLLKLQSSTGKFTADLTPFSFRNVNEYSFFSRTLAAPHVDFLYQQKPTALKEEKAVATDGTMATLISCEWKTYGIDKRFSSPPLNLTGNVLELPRTPTRPSPHPFPVSSPPERDESSCEKDSISSRRFYSRWERKPSTSTQRMKSLQSHSSCSMVGSKIRVKQADKPPPSPPKIIQRRTSREMSLENLRKKVKKAVSQNSNSQIDKLNEKRRRSSHAVTNTSSNQKLRNKRESKTKKNEEVTKDHVQDAKDEAEEQEIDDESCLVTQRDVQSATKEDVQDTTSEPGKHESEHMNDVLSVVESISTIATPTSIRRLTTPKILKIDYVEGQHTDRFSSLRKVFTKLDSDGDGHLSFDELKRSLPSDLTKRQLDYLKKIYLMACESTFFGFEEFVAVNQMCDVIAHVSPSISNAFESMDINCIEEKLTKYLELFTYLDRRQTGSLDISSFKEMLASAVNIQRDNDLVTGILALLGKRNDDVISSVELLVLVPYLIQITSS